MTDSREAADSRQGDSTSLVDRWRQPPGYRLGLNRISDVPGGLLDVGVGLLLVIGYFVFLIEPLPVDPMIYLEAAQNLPESELNHWTTRIGLLVPVSLVSLLFGFSEFSLYLVPFAFVFVFGAATSALGRRLLGPVSGVCAAFVAAAGPVILPYGTQLLPDVGAAALLTASLLFVFRTADGSKQLVRRNALVAGMLFGAAYLVRETVLAFIPATVVVALVMRLRVRELAWMAVGALTAPLMEVVAGLILWGEALPRLEAILGKVPDTITAQQLERSGRSYSAQANLFLSFKIFIDLIWQWVYGKIVLIGSLCFAALAALQRRRAHLALASWILLAWLAFALLGTIRISGRLLIRLLLERYWAFLMPALAIAVVAVVVLAVRWASERWRFKPLYSAIGTVLVVGTVVAGSLASFDLRGDWFVRFGNDGYWQLRTTLEKLPSDTQMAVPGRIDDLVLLYTKDSFGTEIADVEIGTYAAEGTSTAEEWMLVHEDEQRPNVLTAEQSTTAAPMSYRLFAAEEDEPEWVIVTIRDEAWLPAREIFHIDLLDVEWQARSVVDGSWGDPFRVPSGPFQVPSGQRLIVFDSSAAYGSPNDMPVVASGTLIEAQLSMTLDEGRIDAVCHFYPSDRSDRIDVRALSPIENGPIDGHMAAFCRVPEGRGPVQVRPVFVVDGPASVDFREGRLLAYDFRE